MEDQNDNGIHDQWDNLKFLVDLFGPYFLIVLGVAIAILTAYNPPKEKGERELYGASILLIGGGLNGTNGAKKKERSNLR